MHQPAHCTALARYLAEDGRVDGVTDMLPQRRKGVQARHLPRKAARSATYGAGSTPNSQHGASFCWPRQEQLRSGRTLSCQIHQRRNGIRGRPPHLCSHREADEGKHRESAVLDLLQLQLRHVALHYPIKIIGRLCRAPMASHSNKASGHNCGTGGHGTIPGCQARSLTGQRSAPWRS